METAFSKSIHVLLGIEGDYVNDPADSGGATRFGITEATARRHGHKGPMSQLPLSVAKEIYQKEFWDTIRGDDIAGIYLDVSYEVFEAGVLSGPGRSAKWLQRYLNIMNDGGRLYADISVDGMPGRQTLAALEAYARARGQEGEDVMLAGLNSFQGEYLLHLAEKRRKDERFAYGWIRHRAMIHRPLSRLEACATVNDYAHFICEHVRI